MLDHPHSRYEKGSCYVFEPAINIWQELISRTAKMTGTALPPHHPTQPKPVSSIISSSFVPAAPSLLVHLHSKDAPSFSIVLPWEHLLPAYRRIFRPGTSSRWHQMPSSS